MPFCPECGQQNPDNARFCQNCGQAFPQAQTQPQPAQAAPQRPAQAGNPGAPANAMPGAGPGYAGTTAPVRQKTPIVGGILGFLGFGLGAFYNGQIAKGATLLGITIVFWGLFLALGPLPNFLIGIALAIDGYKISQRINNGETVGPWQFF
jgi:TM2 domain-containing membrane protein YozV